MNLRAMLAAIVLATATSASVAAGETHTDWREADFRDALCAGMRMEVVLKDFGRADCVSDTYAIEVEWADKFKEGVGQALTYATATTLIPGLILVCRRSEASCLADSLTAQETFAAFGIEAVIWECGLDSSSLSECLERHIAPRP